MSFADHTLDELLQLLEAPAPSPCGGATAAITAAMACSLVAMVARGAGTWEEGESVAAQATALRTQLLDLARLDAEAVAGLVRLARLPEAERSDALEQAIGVPAKIRDAAGEAAALAALAEENGKAGMRADATAARILAGAGARVAGEIVATNSAE
jgi:formiminotetrahydrofolate cyclodeaminase